VQMTRSGSGNSGSAALEIGGVTVGVIDLSESNGYSWGHNRKFISWIIPTGVSYEITLSSAAVQYWWELR